MIDAAVHSQSVSVLPEGSARAGSCAKGAPSHATLPLHTTHTAVGHPWASKRHQNLCAPACTATPLAHPLTQQGAPPGFSSPSDSVIAATASAARHACSCGKGAAIKVASGDA